MGLTQNQLEQFKPLHEKAIQEGWQDWIKDERDKLAMLDGCYFDKQTAERFRLFCSNMLCLEHPTEPGEIIPFELLDFQYQDIMGPLLGWKRKDGTRRYRYGFITVAKGNTKSAMAAAVLLYLTFGEGEPVVMSYAASTSDKAARNVFEFCARMVRNSPPLSKALKILDHTGRIIDVKRHNALVVCPNRPDAAEGKNVHCCVYDEVHLARDRKLFEAIEHSGRSRKQSLLLVITTAADDRAGLAYELYEDAQKIISGAVVDHTRFAYIAEASNEDNPTDPKVWEKSNPALGVTVNRDDFAAMAKLASDSPAKLRNFKRRRLNVWGLNDTQAFLNFDKWSACRTDVDEGKLRGRKCYGGLDLSSNTDLTAFVLLFPDDAGKFDVLAYHWLPEDVLAERARKECDKYIEWNQQGFLETTPGDFIDQTYIRKRIGELAATYQIMEVAYDPSFAADLGPKLHSDGLNVFEFWQTHRMYSPVMAKLDALVLSGDIRHDNPMLDWQASNLQAHSNEAGHLKPAKTSKRLKIDGMTSLLMALGNIIKDGAQEEYIYTESLLVL